MRIMTWAHCRAPLTRAFTHGKNEGAPPAAQGDDVNEFGDREMPPELASRLLTEQAAQLAALSPGGALCAVQREVLALLIEECAEVTQLLRFGTEPNPYSTESALGALARELGDLCVAMALCSKYGVVDEDAMVAARRAKLVAMQVNDGRLRHANANGIK